jgi:hypothetical protein
MMWDSMLTHIVLYCQIIEQTKLDEFRSLCLTSQSDLNTVTYKVEKALSTVNRDHWDEFKTALGNEEKADHMVENFRRFNNASDRDSIMANGIVFTLIHQHRLGRVVLLQILGIGTSRYKQRRSYQEY